MIFSALSSAALGFLVAKYGYGRGWSLPRSMLTAFALWCVARLAPLLFA